VNGRTRSWSASACSPTCSRTHWRTSAREGRDAAIAFQELVSTILAKLLTAGVANQDRVIHLGLVRPAAAIIGMPFTPMSYAGVARRTTRRVVAVEATAATAAVATTAAVTSQEAAMAQQQAATARQQQQVAQQQAATAKQQAAVAQQQAQAAGAPALGTVVGALPAGCAGEAKGGVEYYKCGNVYYRAAFQGNNLVYVVQQP
jgi:restriction endonuclease Mrr